MIYIRLTQVKEVVKSFNQTKTSLSEHLTKYYRANPKLGGRDRKQLADLVYAYYRSYFALSSLEFEVHIALASFLSELDSKIITEICNFAQIDSDKLSVAYILETWKIDLLKAFPHYDLLGDIDKDAFVLDSFKSRTTWIRIRRGNETSVLDEFAKNNVYVERDLELINAYNVKGKFKADTMNSYINGMFEIQDRSSQATLNFFPNIAADDKWWDVCAGSGGKSLMLQDAYRNVKLYVTDVRETILQNLSKRFSKIGLTKYARAVVDVSQPNPLSDQGSFPKMVDGIILDVPCSGSGTWSRTPELLQTVDRKQIEEYALTQYKIARNTLQYLKTNGVALYITCSVYQIENELIVQKLAESSELIIDQMSYVTGVGHNADTLFIARLIKK